ncbi:MAG: DUF6377 domain-containing protein [Salinivirgaceae bacterium]|nr:DUF6377 domain-containing protein [Salinivirgaceae bacterium]
MVVVLFINLPLKLKASNNTKKLLNELVLAIEERDTYEQNKLNRIQYLMNEIVASKNSENLKLEYNFTFKLYEEYQSFIYDSAFKYVRKLITIAQKLDDSETINQAKIELGFTYLSSGLFKESLDTLFTINAKTLNFESRVDYYDVLSRAHFDLSSYHNDTYYSGIYTKLGIQIVDSAIRILSDTTSRYWMLVGIRNAQSKNLQNAVDAFNFLISQYRISQHDYAIATSALGWVYNSMGRTNDALDMNLRAAIADIKTSTKETVAFRSLALMFYHNDKLELAYKFINIALENATYYNARHRKLEISEILPIIEGKRLTALEKQRKQLMNYGKVTTLLIVLVTFFIVIIYRQLKKLRTIKSVLQTTNENLKGINDTLRETNKIKEEYIGYFFSINSEFIERLSKIQKTLNRKIISRQFDDLKNVIKSSDLNKERERLYINFDKIFLKLFPHFIDEFNKLFNPEDQVIVEKDELLNTDLRIFALIRLGITDTEKIAQFLNYTVNTIYTYKTKRKHKTIVPRDKFDEHIMAIRAVAP